jgi:hypothetical protein
MITLLCLLAFILVDADTDEGDHAEQMTTEIHIIKGIHDARNGNDHDYDDYDFFVPDSRIWSCASCRLQVFSSAPPAPGRQAKHESSQRYNDPANSITGIRFPDYTVWSRGSFV